MTGGYTGKILRINLSTGTISNINTSDYEEYGGGNGMGAAIFWDLAVAPGNWDLLDGFDPRNVVTVMISPLAGTLAPACGGRCEINGIGAYQYPTGWFTRSGIGGTFAGELKAAGWDGVVIEGKASVPVWINIVNDHVEIRDATSDGDALWGLDTFATQEEIWRLATDKHRFGEWLDVGGSYTTQRPAVLCIGPAGENLTRVGTIQHGNACAGGQGGFGGIWGSKNLKAISALGTGSVEVADPTELMDARLWISRQHSYNVDDPLRAASFGMGGLMPARGFLLSNYGEPNRANSCQTCPFPCRRRYQSGATNDATCMDSAWGGSTSMESRLGCDLGQKLGINSCEGSVKGYVRNLYEMGAIGPGTSVDTAPLPMDAYGTLAFNEEYLKAIAYRQGIGDDLAEGGRRASEKWGRAEEDLDSGLLPYPYWGYYQHDPGGCEWNYGTILGDRDINEHDFTHIYWTIAGTAGLADEMPAATLVDILAVKLDVGDPFAFDESDSPTGIYSANKAKKITYHRHYTRFWKQSILYCDWAYPMYINAQNPAGYPFDGYSPEAEPRFYNAVTGNNITFAGGIEIGRKIWNLQKAIWVLQGRHRDQEKCAPYMYKMVKPWGGLWPMSVYLDGAWRYDAMPDRMWNEDGVEQFKTHFYEREGWNTSNGWPTRATLEGLGLKNAADKLEANGKLG